MNTIFVIEELYNFEWKNNFNVKLICTSLENAKQYFHATKQKALDTMIQNGTDKEQAEYRLIEMFSDVPLNDVQNNLNNVYKFEYEVNEVIESYFID